MTVTWRALLGDATARLGAEPDARRIVEEASGYEGADVFAHLDEPVTELAGRKFVALVDRRAAGEPLQYVLGRWAFRRLDLFVDRRVLIPRPETEVVAGVAIEELTRLGGRRVAVDLGTGSGAIALAIADEVAGADVWAADSSLDALAVARANLAGAGGKVARRVQLCEGEWYGALPDELRGQVDVIVSNPPYVADSEQLPPEVRDWEPACALFAGPRGTECLEAIVDGAGDWLAPLGALVLEIAPHQSEAMRGRCEGAGFTEVEVHSDLAGRHRAVLARRR